MSQPNPDREENMPVAATPDAASPTAYRIEEDEDDLIFRIPKTLATRERVSRFLDWLEFEQLRSRSELAQEDAAELAAEVKRAVWEANRFRAGAA